MELQWHVNNCLTRACIICGQPNGVDVKVSQVSNVVMFIATERSAIYSGRTHILQSNSVHSTYPIVNKRGRTEGLSELEENFNINIFISTPLKQFSRQIF